VTVHAISVYVITHDASQVSIAVGHGALTFYRIAPDLSSALPVGYIIILCYDCLKIVVKFG